jgi:hypothetical protein
LPTGNPRYAHRRAHGLLVAEGWQVNVKRIERSWRAQGDCAFRRVGDSKAIGQRASRSDDCSAWNLPATRPLHVWAYDFVSICTATVAGLRVLNVVDEFTRRGVGCFVAYSIGATLVRRTMTTAFVKPRPASDHPLRQRP